MKKFIYLAVALATFAFTSCEDALDTESYTSSNTQNFPASFDDAEMLVTSMYANLNHAASKPESSYLLSSIIASDDCYGALGQSYDHLQVSSDTEYDFCWEIHYKGVTAANLAIEGLTKMADQVSNQEKVNQLLGEAYFMRAFQYHELTEMFGRVPLILSTSQDSNSPQATEEELYGQMGADLLRAIDLMSPKKYNEYVESGHATRWAAEALLARVWLFYTGFYQKDAMPNADGSPITKDQVVSLLSDCIQNSGHALVGDFRNLWSYTNRHTVNDYKYTAGVMGVDRQPLLWAGNGNQEEVFAVKFCNFSGYTYANQKGYANLYRAFFGFKNKGGTNASFPFGMGNAFGTVTKCLWEEWEQSEPNDLRRKASIARDVDEFDMSIYEDGQVTGMYDETGLWNKKCMPILSNDAYALRGSWADALFWAAEPEYDGSGWVTPQWGALFEDYMVIRFADVLLMQSELTGDAQYMNRVRARVGLSPVTYSLENLQRERRHELAFEGTRWADIRRWHIAEQELAKQNGATVLNLGTEHTIRDGKYVSRYQQTQGFWPIPVAQIQLSDGVLHQNDGWGTAESLWTVWNYD